MSWKKGKKATGRCFKCDKELDVPSWFICNECEVKKIRYTKEKYVPARTPKKDGVYYLGQNKDGLRIVG